MKKRLEGTIKTITFHNEENGYSVIKLTPSDDENSLFNRSKVTTIVGEIIEPKVGEFIRLEGDYKTHPKFGSQFVFDYYEKDQILKKEGLIDYLSSDLFKGVGPKTATKIIETLGEDALKKIRKNKDILKTVKAIPKSVIQSLPEQLQEETHYETIRVELMDIGLSVKLIKSLIQVYKDQTLDQVKKNPYQLIQTVKGIGFERADEIAFKLGFKKDDPKRLQALTVHQFDLDTLRAGHTHLVLESFLESLSMRLRNDALENTEDSLKELIETTLKNGLLTLVDSLITKPLYEEAENVIAAKVKELIALKTTSDEDLLKGLKVFQEISNIKYTEEQELAIKQAFKSKIFALTGGPGTGKTTIIKGMVESFKARYKKEDIILLAPTGKAAKRLEEATNHPASTIHRFLKIRFEGDHSEDTDIKQKPVIIIDEMSMVDTVLMKIVCKAIDTPYLILVGDDAQLQSVSPGQVFKDLLTAKIPQVSLKTIHRQAATSEVITLASGFRNRQFPESLKLTGPSLYFVEERPELFYERLKKMIQYYLRSHDDLSDFQVIIPTYHGELGIDAVNTFIQTEFNPQKVHTFLKNRPFKINDKIHQLVNDYDHDVMNGDQGFISAIDPVKKTLTVSFDEKEVTYTSETIDSIKLAYSISVHKSQGSGFDTVVIPLFHPYKHMLSNPLVYTAITRTIHSLIIIGEIHLLNVAIGRNIHPRKTHLTQKCTASNEASISPYDFL
jgi:exodeoxyribonuclease V alpha subunit